MTVDRTSPDSGAPWLPLVIAVAPTGARRSKADHPALPITAEEIAATAAACREAGAAMIHLHVRDRDGRHLLDAEAYRAATKAIRDVVGDGMIVQVTSEAAGVYGPDEQMAVIRETRPEAVSLAVREIVPDATREPEAARFLAWIEAEGILPQYILYSEEDLARFRELCRRGVVPGERHFLLLVLGRYTAGQISEPGQLLPFLAGGLAGDDWGVCAFGRWEAACIAAAAALGGHARVGFENNFHRADGSLAGDNADLVTGVAAMATDIGRSIASAVEAREILWRRPGQPALRTAGGAAT